MSRNEITRILEKLRDQKPGAIEELVPLILPTLREMARRALWRAGRKDALTTNALVNEAYIKLFDRSRLEWVDRGNFFAAAALTMRRILVDEARRRRAQKRGGGLERVELDSHHGAVLARWDQVLAVDEALSRLGLIDERLVEIVNLRFFLGRTNEEVADLMGLSVRTVIRRWREAQAFLRNELKHGADE